MRSLLAAVVASLACFATFVSFVATRDAAGTSWEQVSRLIAVNFLIACPLWFVAVFLATWRSKRGVLASAVVALGVATVLSLLQTGIHQAQMAGGERIACSNQMKMIGLAIQQYESRYGCLPPAYIADAKGKPIHSWRVLLLPFLEQNPRFLEQNALYRAYSFDEPWDGPRNRELSKTIVRGYPCPADSANPENASYLAVVGPGTAWPGAKSIRTKDIRDRLDKTILLVEVADSGINWMEPRDLSFDHMDFHINGKPRTSLSSHHGKGANVLFADMHVEYLRDTVLPETVRALLTIAAGEAIPPRSP
jgi:prepilin-type processing-associated H-X9-DG protein